MFSDIENLIKSTLLILNEECAWFSTVIKNTKHAQCFKAATRQFRPVRCCGCRQCCAVDMGKVYPGFLEYSAVFDNARPSTTAFFALPTVFDKVLLAVNRFKRSAYTVLQIEEIA